MDLEMKLKKKVLTEVASLSTTTTPTRQTEGRRHSLRQGQHGQAQREL